MYAVSLYEAVYCNNHSTKPVPPHNCLKSDGLYRERIRGMPTQRNSGDVGQDMRGALNTPQQLGRHTHTHTSQEREGGCAEGTGTRTPKRDVGRG